MNRLLVVDTMVRVLFHSILVLSLYFLFAGHNQPGGGFIGGLTAGAAISFRYVAGGVDEVRRSVPLRPWTILGGGLLVASCVAIVPIVLGHDVLEHVAWEIDVPLLGVVKTTSALPFDVGVYLVVVGLILMMFEAFGDDVAEDEAAGFDVPSDALEADSLDVDVFELDRIAVLAEQRRQRQRPDAADGGTAGAEPGGATTADEHGGPPA